MASYATNQKRNLASDCQSELRIDAAVLPRRLGLCFPEALSFDSWRRVGAQMKLISDSSAWWLGDWLVYGETAFSDRYKQAIAETLLDYQTLRNYAWVARRFEMSRRRDGLSFQHHAEVATLPGGEQDRWLDLAEQYRWSRNELRRQLKASRRQLENGDGFDKNGARQVVLQVNIAPERKRLWEEAAERSHRDLVEWMTEVLDSAAGSAS